MDFIPYEVFDAKTNMQIDEDILNQSIANQDLKPTLRLYGWQNPSVTIGRNQKEDCVNLEFCKQNGIETARRITGGRAVLHHQELTYSFVCPISVLQKGETVIQSYKEISGVIIEAFKELGIELELPQKGKCYTGNDYCMAISTGSDLSYKGKKLIGSAQFRKQGYLLQHGSILFDMDKELLAGVFNKNCHPKLASDSHDIKVIARNEVTRQSKKPKLLRSAYNDKAQILPACHSEAYAEESQCLSPSSNDHAIADQVRNDNPTLNIITLKEINDKIHTYDICNIMQKSFEYRFSGD